MNCAILAQGGSFNLLDTIFYGPGHLDFIFRILISGKVALKMGFRQFFFPFFWATFNSLDMWDGVQSVEFCGKSVFEHVLFRWFFQISLDIGIFGKYTYGSEDKTLKLFIIIISIGNQFHIL
ncbi:hypothetical protein RhiirB3_388581 [Rhizophagus irregularis]|nr:hypothetical protein RhiirB3_388581 [Rhizophagus irregularis]